MTDTFGYRTKSSIDALRAEIAEGNTTVDEIDTPTLVIDLDAMDRNLARMKAFAEQHNVKLRPHSKLHKCAELAKLQMEKGGAVGICVQKISEAEAMAENGVTDIFISNEVVAESKLARVAELYRSMALRGGKLTIAVDSVEGIDGLAAAITSMLVTGTALTNDDEDSAPPPAATTDDAPAQRLPPMGVFIEIEVGQKRCGCLPGAPAVALANCIKDYEGILELAGLHAYHGWAQHVRSYDERVKIIGQTAASAKQTVEALTSAGFRVPIVTGAGTGTFSIEATSGVYNEIQPGSYLVLDKDYGDNEADSRHPAFEHALFLKTSVMSRADDRVVLDAGHKSAAIDTGAPGVWGPLGKKGVVCDNGGDDHGVLRGPAGSLDGIQLRDTVWLVPNHCDPTFNLHDFVLGVRGRLQSGTVTKVFTVDARGCQW